MRAFKEKIIYERAAFCRHQIFLCPRIGQTWGFENERDSWMWHFYLILAKATKIKVMMIFGTQPLHQMIVHTTNYFLHQNTTFVTMNSWFLWINLQFQIFAGRIFLELRHFSLLWSRYRSACFRKCGNRNFCQIWRLTLNVVDLPDGKVNSNARIIR